MSLYSDFELASLEPDTSDLFIPEFDKLVLNVLLADGSFNYFVAAPECEVDTCAYCGACLACMSEEPCLRSDAHAWKLNEKQWDERKKTLEYAELF